MTTDLFSQQAPSEALLSILDSRCFDDTGRRIRIPEIDLASFKIPCDLAECTKIIDWPWLTITNITDFQRLNKTAFHGFCCAEHRSIWWAKGHDGDFWTVSESPGDLLASDRGIQLNHIVYDGPGAHDQMMALCDPETGAVVHRTPGDLALCAIFSAAVDLNRWWATADAIERTGAIEILYSKAA